MQVNNYKLIIPVAPDSVNKVIKYGKSEGDIVVLKHKWEKLAMILINQAIDNQELPEKFHGRIAVFFKLFFSSERGRDGDNYAAMCKGIIDAMVSLNMIPDDNKDWIDDDGRRLRVDSERPRAEVYIEEFIPDDKLVNIETYAKT